MLTLTNVKFCNKNEKDHFNFLIKQKSREILKILKNIFMLYKYDFILI